MYASALHDMRSTKARKLSMELSVNWTSFVAKSFVQLVTRVCKGGCKHSPTRIAHRATNSGDSIFRNGENTMRLPKQHAESLVCYIKFITGDSSPPSSPCHHWYGERRPRQSEHPCRGFKRPQSVIQFCFFFME